MTITFPQWLIPLVCMVLLLALLPVVIELDDSRMIQSANRNMKRGLVIENQTDSKANEIAFIQERINELLRGSGGTLVISRTGNVDYTQDQDNDYTAQFFINSLSLYVRGSMVQGECMRGDCITIKNDGVLSNENRQFSSIAITTQNAEQGDRLVQYLQQYQQLSNNDATIKTGFWRKLKKWYDRLWSWFQTIKP